MEVKRAYITRCHMPVPLYGACQINIYLYICMPSITVLIISYKTIALKNEIVSH